MELSVDGFGRVVIPKRARQLLGLAVGDKLDVEITEDEIVLRPRRAKGKIIRESGVLVWDGALAGVDTIDLLRSQREDRSATIVGDR